MIRTRSEQTEEQREQMRGGAGTVTVRHYFKPEEMTMPVRLCAELTLPPGSGIGPHRHANEEEIYLVTRGTGLLTEDGMEKRISAGDAVLTGGGASHAVHNDGTEPLHITAVIVTG